MNQTSEGTSRVFSVYKDDLMQCDEQNDKYSTTQVTKVKPLNEMELIDTANFSLCCHFGPFCKMDIFATHGKEGMFSRVTSHNVEGTNKRSS